MTEDTLICEMSVKDFEFLRGIVFKESGINLTEKKKALMQSRLIKRLRALKLKNYPMYCDYLSAHYDQELINLINCITTNKTDFFRENKHFEFIKSEILPVFERNSKETIRVWSAGCSTGEEPYSIAITIAEYLKNKTYRPDVKILATDIDTNVLNTGINGLYKKEEFDNMDQDIFRRYFSRYKGDKDKEGFYEAGSQLKNLIYFRRLNLLEKEFPMRKKFDMIFCRNVIIYFDRNTRTELMGKFYNYLYDDGFFFAGHSENLPSFTEMYTLVGNTIYKKVLKCTQEAVKDLIKK